MIKVVKKESALVSKSKSGKSSITQINNPLFDEK
tara:strand:- start:2276 stop:2377 length:102 start_codon:yes stop_codon:yes gene_type:complete